MNNDLDRCNKLRRLHEHLVNEVNRLNEEVRAMEREGVGNPTGTRSIIKSLQSSLYTIDLELQNCPPEDRPDESPASVQQAAKSMQYTAKAFIPEDVKASEVLESEEDEDI